MLRNLAYSVGKKKEKLREPTQNLKSSKRFVIYGVVRPIIGKEM